MNNGMRLLSTAVVLLVTGIVLAMTVPLATPPGVHAAGGVLYAAPSAQGVGDCSSWTDACTLQSALAGAISGDEIWVKEGVHKPTSDPADRGAYFGLKNGVAVYGGFAGAETSRAGRDWQAHLTILSGDIDGNDTNADGNFIAETPADIQGANSCRLVWNAGVGATAVLDGFVVTGGKCDPLDVGAGIYNYEASPTLANLILIGNAAAEGGGMHNNHGSSPTLTNISFVHNSASGNGGGLKNYWECGPVLTNVAFIGNTAGSAGGGVDQYVSGMTLTNGVFRGNSASGAAGMHLNNSSANLTNVTFHGNTATGDPGGIFLYYSGVTLNNVIMWGE